MNSNLYDKALRLHQAQRLSKAETLYHDMLDKDPNNIEVLHLLGILKAQQNDLQTALTYLKKCIKINAKSPQLHNTIGNIYKRLHDTKNAIKHYQKSIKLQPDYASAYSNLGNIYYQEKKWDEAKKYYECAIKLDPKFTDALFNLGTLHANKNEYEQAIKYLEQVLKLEPKHQRAHNQLAQVYHQQQAFKPAINHYEKVLQAEESDEDTHYRLGAALVKSGKLDAAIEHFEQAIQYNPGHLDAIYNLGATHLALNQLDKALKYYNQLLIQQPSLEVYYNLGVIYMYQDRHRSAIDFFQQALQLDPYHFDTLLNLGATYLKRNQYDKAAEYYQEAHKLQPDNQELTYILTALTQSDNPQHPPAEYIQHLFDQYAPHFDQHLTHYLHYQAPQLIQQAAIEYLGRDQDTLKIVDLGCGTGLCGCVLRALAKRLIGIDISPQMINQASQKKVYDELITGDIHKVLSQLSGLDLIAAADVFGYVGDLSEVFKQVKKALNPTGFFLFTIENDQKNSYNLQKNGRYAHSQNYIKRLAMNNQFHIERCDNIILRTQNKHPVEGYLYLLTLKKANYSASSLNTLKTCRFEQLT